MKITEKDWFLIQLLAYSLSLENGYIDVYCCASKDGYGPYK